MYRFSLFVVQHFLTKNLTAPERVSGAVVSDGCLLVDLVEKLV